jgi:hypothetical protein
MTVETAVARRSKLIGKLTVSERDFCGEKRGMRDYNMCPLTPALPHLVAKALRLSPVPKKLCVLKTVVKVNRKAVSVDRVGTHTFARPASLNLIRSGSIKSVNSRKAHPAYNVLYREHNSGAGVDLGSKFFEEFHLKYPQGGCYHSTFLVFFAGFSIALVESTRELPVVGG